MVAALGKPQWVVLIKGIQQNCGERLDKIKMLGPHPRPAKLESLLGRCQVYFENTPWVFLMGCSDEEPWC